MASIRTIPGWREMSGAELVAFTQSHPETAVPIPAQSLRNWFADNRFAWLDLSNSWVGPLPDSIGSAPDEAAAGLERLFAHLSFAGSQVVDTDRESYAGLLMFVMYVLQPSGDQLAAFYALAGGRKYPLFTTTEQAESARDTAAIEDDKYASLSAVQSRAEKATDAARTEYRKAESTPQSITEAAETAWGEA